MQRNRTRSAAGGTGRSSCGFDGRAIVDGVGESAERAGELGVADAVEDGPALLGCVEHARAGEQSEVAGDDREINGATLGNLADGATPRAFGDAGDERETGGIAEGLKERGFEQVVDGSAAGCGVAGRGGGTFFAYLRHHASIGGAARRVKPGAGGAAPGRNEGVAGVGTLNEPPGSGGIQRGDT